MLSLLLGYEDAGLAIMFQSGGLRGQRECYVIFPLLTQICRNILFCKYKFYFLISAKWISKDSSCIGVSSGCWCVRPDGKMHPGPGSLGKMETVKCVYTQLSETPLSIKSSTRFFQITISSLVRDSKFLMLNTLFKGEIRTLSMDEFQRFIQTCSCSWKMLCPVWPGWPPSQCQRPHWVWRMGKLNTFIARGELYWKDSPL